MATFASPLSGRPQRVWVNRRSLLKIFGLSTATFYFADHGSKLWGKNSQAQTSVQLHIFIETKSGKGPELEKLYHSAYVPAIKGQPGFLSSRLLRRYESTSKYEIDISFRNEKQRAAWAESKEHQAAWPKIQEVGEKISWEGFDVLA